MSEDTRIERAARLAKAMVAAPWKRGDEWIIDLMDVEGCGHRMTLYPARNEAQIALIVEDAERWIERILDRAHQREERLIEREATLTRERDKAIAATRQQDEQIRVLREALRRAVHHLGTAAPVNDEESLVSMDDFHAAKMLVGRTDDAWDDAAAERGMRSIRREALGTDDETAR